VVSRPETDYPAPGGRRIAQGGDLAVCYAPDERVVITVLPRSLDHYLRPEKQRLRWRHEPERVITALVSTGSDAGAAAAALGYFGLDAAPIALDSGRRLVHVAAVDELIDMLTGRRWPAPIQLFLEEPFELDGETYRYVPAWTSVDDAAVAGAVAAVRARLEEDDVDRQSRPAA